MSRSDTHSERERSEKSYQTREDWHLVQIKRADRPDRCAYERPLDGSDTSFKRIMKMVRSPNLICLVQTRNTGFVECERGVFVRERGATEEKEEWNTFSKGVGLRIRRQV